ncbi:hypothetical protein BBJ28_00001024 [Nothophytophthora sp. Chile5]|nr:hypothetical protein BBJ28_00001024 [Nothophytophthora sp. Chile5]
MAEPLLDDPEESQKLVVTFCSSKANKTATSAYHTASYSNHVRGCSEHAAELLEALSFQLQLDFTTLTFPDASEPEPDQLEADDGAIAMLAELLSTAAISKLKEAKRAGEANTSSLELPAHAVVPIPLK